MIHFEHDKTLIVGHGTRPDWTVKTTHEAMPGTTVLLPRIISIEWTCSACGESGPGFMPEPHASGACEATRGFQQWECVPCGVRGMGPMPEGHGTSACIERLNGFMDGGWI